MTASASSPAPLAGVTVLDLSRMLPGAVLARQLLDFGARLIKVEAPNMGDPMRHSPPTRAGMGVGFSVFFRGAESIELDLRRAEGASALKTLAQSADVLIESFRPGTLAQWGLDPQQLHASNPGLIVCSLPGFVPGVNGPGETSIGHDLNFVAMAGLLSRLDMDQVPGLQLADVTTGMLAAQGILAALLRRARTGQGTVFAQPIAVGPLLHVLWPWADAEAGSPTSMTNTVIGGRCPAYKIYRCADDRGLAVGCLEPKFWAEFCTAVGQPDLVPAGLDMGASGQVAMERMAAHLQTESADAWMEAIRGQNLPVTIVHDLDGARQEPFFTAAKLLEATPLPDGSSLSVPGPAVPGLGATPDTPAPQLGRHTRAILQEFDAG